MRLNVKFKLISGMGNREVLQQVEIGYRMPQPALATDSFYDIMMKCWDANPDSRPTFEYLYAFFDDFFVSTEPNYRDPDDV